MMPAKYMVIRDLARFPARGPGDTLTFEPGVNVIVGPPNTGKTQWLKILDHLLGDESSAENRLAEEVAEKYESAALTASIAGNDHTFERHWKKPGLKTKVVVDGEPLDTKEFSRNLLSFLDIPLVHYPQGDPYGPRTWPELGWRSLLRHIYRQQRFWGDLADKQPDSEQHACLMQFLGIAKNLFSDEYGALVQNNKRLEELKLKKEQFVSMLQEISRELIDVEELGIALTPQSIELADTEIQQEISHLQERRRTILENLLHALVPEDESDKRASIRKLGEDLVALQAQREALLTTRNKFQERMADLEEYLRLTEEELSRITRAEHAGKILAGIKITHCPACDQEIPQTLSATDECFLCHRATAPPSETNSDPTKRLEFEHRQLSAEVDETRELVAALDRNQRETSAQIEKVNEGIRRLQQDLRPTRTAAAAILPPEIGILDMQMGRLDERLQQLKRIAASLKKREQIAVAMTQIQKEVAELEGKVAEQYSRVNFEEQSDFLSDSMNTYLNLIHRSKPMLWTQKPVAIDFRKRDFAFFVGERSWKSKLGGTASLIFLMAYHYGLMSLTNKNDYNYPGLLVLDFPAELDDGSTVRDKENFVLEPFVDLLRKEEMASGQVIAAGSSFENLEGAHRIELRDIWK